MACAVYRLVLADGMGEALDFPFTPASDMAGAVAAVGAGAKRFVAGDRVISNVFPGWIDGRKHGDARAPSYRALGGAYAGVLSEFVALPEEWLTRSPESLDDAHACTLPCAGLTA